MIVNMYHPSPESLLIKGLSATESKLDVDGDEENLDLDPALKEDNLELYLECDDDIVEVSQTKRERTTGEVPINIKAGKNSFYKITFPFPPVDGPELRKRYKCDRCAKTFSRESLLRDHKARTHGVKDLFQCPKCAYRGQLYRHFYKHIKRKHKELLSRMLKCSIFEMTDVENNAQCSRLCYDGSEQTNEHDEPCSSQIHEDSSLKKVEDEGLQHKELSEIHLEASSGCSAPELVSDDQISGAYSTDDDNLEWFITTNSNDSQPCHTDNIVKQCLTPNCAMTIMGKQESGFDRISTGGNIATKGRDLALSGVIHSSKPSIQGATRAVQAAVTGQQASHSAAANATSILLSHSIPCATSTASSQQVIDGHTGDVPSSHHEADCVGSVLSTQKLDSDVSHTQMDVAVVLLTEPNIDKQRHVAIDNHDNLVSDGNGTLVIRSVQGEDNEGAAAVVSEGLVPAEGKTGSLVALGQGLNGERISTSVACQHDHNNTETVLAPSPEVNNKEMAAAVSLPSREQKDSVSTTRMENALKYAQCGAEVKDSPCDSCGKALVSGYKLKTHFKTAQSDRPFACSQPACAKSFKTRRAACEHRLTVHGHKKYKCPHSECNKAYALVRDLKAHAVSHTVVFTCPWVDCEKTFRDKYNMDTHYKTHTGQRDKKCPHCEFTCIQKASLNWHFKKKHPQLF